MTTMISEVYDALTAAGAPEDKARRAAEAIAGFETRFVDPGARLDRLDGRMGAIEARMGGLEGRLGMMTWIIGINLAISLAVLGKLLALPVH